MSPSDKLTPVTISSRGAAIHCVQSINLEVWEGQSLLLELFFLFLEDSAMRVGRFSLDMMGCTKLVAALIGLAVVRCFTFFGSSRELCRSSVALSEVWFPP